jgi:FAD/FMN-containing dehydrogenase
MQSWGGLPATPQVSVPVAWQDEILANWTEQTLAVGCARSYGDVGLAASGTVMNLSTMDRIISFDSESGVIRCEAGATLGQIMQLAVPRGWMLPVLPGTQFVSVAGAMANDIHGKNHHSAGTFAGHVSRMALLRSDGQLIECSAGENPDWFAATAGGLGLTGIILWLEIQLRPVRGPWLDSETIKFDSLAEFYSLSAESESEFEYTVSWIDCLSDRVRGHFTRANHSDFEQPTPRLRRLPAVPFTWPLSPVNRYTLRAFNSVYFHRQRTPSKRQQSPWGSWFFPLDAIGHWNRVYGKAGFRQYQCVVPDEVVTELLGVIRHAGEGSFLAVLKKFGNSTSPALMSFPRPGTTLALDFPFRGSTTTDLFTKLDALVFSSGGAIYPAKDAHMTSHDFKSAYPAWEQIEAMRDPKINSLFWQRVTGESP